LFEIQLANAVGIENGETNLKKLSQKLSGRATSFKKCFDLEKKEHLTYGRYFPRNLGPNKEPKRI
jgi:hypothetical protein